MDSHSLEGYLSKNQTSSWVTTVYCQMLDFKLWGTEELSQFKQNRKFQMVRKVKEDLFFFA